MAFKAGDKAPAFSLPATDGREISLAELKGRKAVLYFYPKDDTSGCTLEAQNFQSSASRNFAAADTDVIGISPDSLKSHDKFRGQIRASISPSPRTRARAMLEAYGVWVEKSMYGRKYMGVERTTMLIDRDGTIAQIWHEGQGAGPCRGGAGSRKGPAVTSIGTKVSRPRATFRSSLTLTGFTPVGFCRTDAMRSASLLTSFEPHRKTPRRRRTVTVSRQTVLLAALRSWF